ncbi:MAG TPA: S41 family peptidase [Patescibacteria group bacterium]|nr:S41 family peptidase [Patescibacteria group bacterium]
MKNRVKVIQVGILVLVAFFIGYFFGINKINYDWKNYKPQIKIASKEPPSGISNVDFSPFWTVWQKIEEDYYDKTKIDPQKMLNGAIAGALQSLDDPFTVYLPPVQNDSFKQGLAGQFSGIGAELMSDKGNIIVMSPLSETPAERAGIKAGDVIVKVDGKSIIGWSITQAVENIRGEKGTEVILTVIHKDTNNKQVDIKIIRDIITVKSVEGYIKKVGDIENIKVSDDKKNLKVTYIRLSQFGDNTNKDWTDLIIRLAGQIRTDKDVKGVILDLRNNPGGYLTDAVFIASEFLNQGKPVVIEDDVINKKTLSANRNGQLTNIPLVILINRGSASASEIVAGALRDNKKTKLIGETSFGKGTIQQAEDLGKGAGIHVTIAKWLTPDSIWVNGEGLKPDIEVKLDPKNPTHDTQLEKAVEELLK